MFRRGPVTYTYTFTSNGNPGELMGPGMLPMTMGGFPGNAAGGPGSMDLANLQARPYHWRLRSLSVGRVRYKRLKIRGSRHFCSPTVCIGCSSSGGSLPRCDAWRLVQHFEAELPACVCERSSDALLPVTGVVVVVVPAQQLWMGRWQTHGVTLPHGLQLALMDRDFTDEDYEMLSALDRHGPANARPVSQQALDELPHFTHHVKARVVASVLTP